jgi:hypothetical protein
MRWPLAIWRKHLRRIRMRSRSMLRATATRSSPVALIWCRGRAIAEVVIRREPFTLQEKALDDSGESYLGGGQVIDGWLAVNLRGNRADGLGGWSDEQIIATLRSARDPVHAVIGGAMSDVVVHSTQYLTDADLRAVASYLKTLPPDRTRRPRSRQTLPPLARWPLERRPDGGRSCMTTTAPLAITPTVVARRVRCRLLPATRPFWLPIQLRSFT